MPWRTLCPMCNGEGVRDPYLCEECNQPEACESGECPYDNLCEMCHGSGQIPDDFYDYPECYEDCLHF